MHGNHHVNALTRFFKSPIRPFRSLRWGLQLWHAGLLAVVLVGFGAASYAGVRRMSYQDVDTRIERSLQTIMAGVHPGPPDFGPGGGAWGGGNGGGPGDRSRGPRDGGPDHSFDRQFDRGPPNGDRGGGGPNGGGPRRGGGGGGPFNLQVDLPAALAARFASDSLDAPYYLVWNLQGERVAAGGPAEEIAYPGTPPAPSFRGPGTPEPPVPRARG